jgi:hypothetical protein
MKRVYMLTAIAAVSFFTNSASAYVIGTITENPCGGGGVTVTASTIVWAPIGTQPGTGCVNTGTPTNLSWTGGGSLGTNVNGDIKNLTSPGPPSVDKFITFPNITTATLDFVLTLLGPGSSNVGLAGCTAANANGLSCSVIAGSPFILTYDNGSTDVALHASGTIADPNAPTQMSNWSGGFSVTVAGQTPLQVYNTFISAGSITTGQQGQFVMSTIPEPGTIGMMLIGGLLVAFARKRKAKA